MTTVPNDQNTVYVTGHKHPDTDSICSAIAYAQLKEKLGVQAVACRLGDINNETSYLLKRFGFELPEYLDDARSQLQEIEYDRPISIMPETTIFEAWQLMNSNGGKRGLVVTDEANHLLGMVTNSNLTAVAMGDTAKSIELLKKTPIEYIVKTIKGKLIYAPETTRLNGKVSIIAVAEHKLDNYELSDRTVIVGNDWEAQLQAVEKDAACLVVVWADFIRDEVIEKAKEKGCAIIISGHGTLNTSRYIFYSSPVKDLMTTGLITFNRNEFVEDVSNKIIKTRYRSYPVVDDKNRVHGLISRYHLLNAKKKKIILVDHNEISQSVEGILEADLLEIIDHHRIGDIQTTKPIMFRNQLVGSTCTIIANLYEETHMKMEKNTAGLLCGAIISDTLNFKSPTTTSIDFHTARRLAQQADVQIDELAKSMFTIGAGLHEKTPIQILEHDIKEFNIFKTKLTVSQMSLYDLNQLKPIRVQLLEAMEAYAQEKQLDLMLMLFTSLEQNGSTMFYAGREKWIAEEAYPGISNDDLYVFADVISRKKQVIPKLSSVIIENHR